MSGSSGPALCRVPFSSSRCGLYFSQVGKSRPGTRTLGFVSLNSRQIFLEKGKLFVGRVRGELRRAEGVGSFVVQALRTDEERRRLNGSKSPSYPPRSPSSPSDVEDETELPFLSGASRRNPNVEEDGGYDEDDREEETRLQPLLAIWRGANRFILAGMGADISVDTVLNMESNNVDSLEVIDRQTPNSDICLAYGISAMVLDQHLFISFNPFNVYVSQMEVKLGCVLRQSNWSVLEARGLVNSEEVRACKRNMNMFGFVGNLRRSPKISCVYHSKSADNLFLKDPFKATLGDGYESKSIEE